MIIKGQKIDGRYQIIRTIGEGGMANVYLAYDTILDREVAVKILRGDLASDDKFIKRFQREAKAASSLSHPNIVEMYDVGEDNGEHFIVMEYVDGKTLKSLIKKRGALSQTEVMDIMLQLTSAIACAHDSYLIHRDIKPQNVLILEDGRVKITDFGIAMALNSTELTQTNSVMGSVHYLPPEQANGSGSTIKSDIYSLGILMYELLIGKLPFKGDNAVEIAIKQMKEKIPSICKQNNLVPQSVENVVLRACAKNPKNRYNSVAEMHADLKTVLSESRADEKIWVYDYPETDLDDTKVFEKTNDEEEKETRQSRNEENEEDMKSGKKSRKLSKFVIISICVSLAVFAAAVFVGMRMIGGTRTGNIALPELEGLHRDEIEEKLQALDFIVIFEREPSEDIEEGFFVSYGRGRRPGTNQRRGSEVIVIISAGQSGVLLRDYVGRNVHDVEAELLEAGLDVRLIARGIPDTEAEDIRDGEILEQSRPAGTRIEDGGRIELTFARIDTVYPDFTGIMPNGRRWTRPTIQAFCEDNQLACTFTDVQSTTEAGRILSQSRAEGTIVRQGASLVIEIAIPMPPPPPDPDDG